MKHLQPENTVRQLSTNITNVKKNSFINEVLTDKQLKQILGGSDGGEDDDDIDEEMEWE